MNGIIQKDKVCYLCKVMFDRDNRFFLEEHHIFKGRNRKMSEEYGMKVWLCRAHHRELHGKDGHDLDLYLERIGQKKFEETGSREEFRRIFGKSYL